VDQPRFPKLGGHTAYGGILPYRLGKLERCGVIAGEWLDVGCAEGYYTVGLAERGAANVVGLDTSVDRVEQARALPHPDTVTYVQGESERLPFEDDSFDGVFLNEVLEHVADEGATLREINRVLRPGGVLALFSPNRWFPVEGHGARWSDTSSVSRRPAPLMPWLPKRLTNRFAEARNYWPSELVRLVSDAGMTIVNRGWALAQFELYPWLPKRVVEWYRRNLSTIERSPAARFFAVSTFILAEATAPAAPGDSGSSVVARDARSADEPQAQSTTKVD
jgi:ubiquinone/menaquinone biosynthesis C-methylase UbiE